MHKITAPNKATCHSAQATCLIKLCFSSKRGRVLCASLMAPVLLALLLPILNVHIVYPAFRQLIVSNIEEDSRRLGMHMLPPALKHSILTSKALTPAFYGNIYKLESEFGLMKIRVFSPLGIVLYSTKPDEIGTRNTQAFFKEEIANGRSYTQLVIKDSKTSEGDLVEIDVVETYVPIMNDKRFLGAFEMYYDVTKRMERLNQLTFYSKIAMGSMSGCLIIVVIFFLRKEVKHQQEKQRADTLMEDVNRITRHDMKSPILSLLAGLTYLEQFTTLNEDQMQMASDMRAAANTAMDMINRSLDLYKMETGTYEYEPIDVDLLAVVRRVVTDLSRFAQDMGVGVYITLSGTPPAEDATYPIQSEEALCYSLVANLVKNAIEASPADKSILITISGDTEHQLAVHNNGAVPEDVRETFFDKYTTAGKSTGTGLGTYSAHLMTNTMGGTIEMTTSKEDGTTITVTLPHTNQE